MSQSSRFNSGNSSLGRIPGEKGETGEKGDVGDGIMIKGVVDSSNLLPYDSNVGDVYIDITNSITINCM